MLSSWMLALALHAPEPAPFAVPPPSVEVPGSNDPVPGAADDHRGKRRWVRAGLVYALSGIAMGGLIATQAVRDGSYRGCMSALARPDDGTIERALDVGLGCTFGVNPPLLTAGSAALGPLTVALAAGGGAVLGRGDVDYGVVRAPQWVRRRIRNSAIALGVSSGVFVVAGLSLFVADAYTPVGASGLAIQRARFAVTDISVAVMSVSASMLARANTYKRRTKLALSPMIGGGIHGIALAGRF